MLQVQEQQTGSSKVGMPAATMPMAVRILAIALRALFIGALVVVTVRVSSPQSESLASVHETLGDLACSGIRGMSVDLDPSFHASQDCRGIQDVGLPRSCSRPARLGGRIHHLVMRSPCPSSHEHGS